MIYPTQYESLPFFDERRLAAHTYSDIVKMSLWDTYTYYLIVINQILKEPALPYMQVPFLFAKNVHLMYITIKIKGLYFNLKTLEVHLTYVRK